MRIMKWLPGVLVAGGLILFMALQNAPKKRIVFFGDSITQMGVDKGGYITRLRERLQAGKKDGQYELIGAGIGGNKVYDLYLRHRTDVLQHQPEAVVIWIGVNDVWHKSWGTGTDADKFEKFYQALIDSFTAHQVRVYLATPAVIGERYDFSNPLDGDLNHYSNIIRRLASRNNCPLIDLRKAFMDHLRQHNGDNKEAGILTTDRVHLNEAGNRLVADLMYAALFNRAGD